MFQDLRNFCALAGIETTGHLKRRRGSHGWIVLDCLEDLDEVPDIKTRLQEMCSTKRRKIRAEGKEDNLFNSHVVFMHAFEMKEGHEPPNEGDKLKFKLYTDDMGVGAYDIELVTKNEEHITKTSRVKTEAETTGHLKRRKGSIGWIVLDWLEDLDEVPDIKTRLEEMCSTKRRKIRAEVKEDNLFNSYVVFMHDFEMKEGDKLKFKLYADDIGVGAYDIEIVKRAEHRAPEHQ